MNVIKIDSLPSIKKEDFINQLIQQILIICKEDKSFTTANKLKKLNEYKSVIKTKNNNLQNLLEKSNKIKEEFNKQLIEIEEDNQRLKQRLIEQLGGEL